MNERIRELIKQATIPADQVENYAKSEGLIVPDEKLDVAKFAELIVQKCADIGERYADGNYEVRNQIMAHFGLEEE